MVFAPLLLLMGQQALERMYPSILQESWLPIASLLILPMFLLVFPMMMPLLLGLHPLPRSALRDRMIANASRLRFRFAQIYLWDTRGAVANAMVVGVVSWVRYVVFTDRLLDEMADDEIDGVLGHEIGHAHHGHILYYAFFLMLSFVLMGALMQTIRSVDDETSAQLQTLFIIAPVAMMGLYMFAVFGFVSRRCERQADVFGCRAGSCRNPHCRGHDETTVLADRGLGLCPTGINAFVRALRHVEEINGMARTHANWSGAGFLGKLHFIFRHLTGWLHTWQHSTIQKRVAFLESIAVDPQIEQRFQRRVGILKWAVAVGLCLCVIALGAWQGWDVLLMAM